MPGKKKGRRKGKHFVLGKDLRTDGHTRITKGENFAVEGGTKDSHEETVDIVHEFSKRIDKEGSKVDTETAKGILKDVLRDYNRRN